MKSKMTRARREECEKALERALKELRSVRKELDTWDAEVSVTQLLDQLYRDEIVVNGSNPWEAFLFDGSQASRTGI